MSMLHTGSLKKEAIFYKSCLAAWVRKGGRVRKLDQRFSKGKEK